MLKRIFLLVVISTTLLLNNCQKENSCNLSADDEQKVAILNSLYEQLQTDTTQFSIADRNLYLQIRAIANDVDALQDNITSNMSHKEKYNTIRANMQKKIAAVVALSNAHFNNNEAYLILCKNAFAVMSYDALERQYPKFLWTKLGIFAANEVRAGLVLALSVKSDMLRNHIDIPINNIPATNILQLASEALISGQLNVLTDIGSLVILNEYGNEALSNESWLTIEARKAFQLQHLAEEAYNNCEQEKYYDLQTKAAIQFGAHEQIYVLQPVWDDDILQNLAAINQLLLAVSDGQIAFFGEIYLGVNKTKTKKGYTVKFPYQSYDLVNPVHRVEVARNGFNTLNQLRKNKDWSYWLDESQIKIGYFLDVYYPTVELL
ncbi:MAG: hypothetical protein H6553_02840 [Chitinophagales bacterium]|nr:hypothetical protein [Chitinophagales bacterium]